MVCASTAARVARPLHVASATPTPEHPHQAEDKPRCRESQSTNVASAIRTLWQNPPTRGQSFPRGVAARQAAVVPPRQLLDPGSRELPSEFTSYRQYTPFLKYHLSPFTLRPLQRTS